MPTPARSSATSLYQQGDLRLPATLMAIAAALTANSLVKCVVAFISGGARFGWRFASGLRLPPRRSVSVSPSRLDQAAHVGPGHGHELALSRFWAPMTRSEPSSRVSMAALGAWAPWRRS